MTTVKMFFEPRLKNIGGTGRMIIVVSIVNINTLLCEYSPNIFSDLSHKIDTQLSSLLILGLANYVLQGDIL